MIMAVCCNSLLFVVDVPAVTTVMVRDVSDMRKKIGIYEEAKVFSPVGGSLPAWAGLFKTILVR